MMNLFKEDYSQYRYFMSDDDIKKIKRNEIVMALIPLLALVYMAMENNYQYVAVVPVLMLLFYKLPYVYIGLVHQQNCNNIRNAIPLWINTLYASIEEDTIHNAIVNSYNDDTPMAIKKDLKGFIDKINKNPEDKSAYMGFLSRYKVSGFDEIMMKLYEFRGFSKEKLKREIISLNKNLNRIKQMKYESRFKGETLMTDTLICFYLFVPSVYITLVSLMPVAM